MSEIWGYGGTHFHYVAAIGQADLKVKNMLTRLTRHGLTARLGYDVNLQDGLGLRCVFITSTIPGMTMPHVPPMGNELPTTPASAYPPVFTLRWLAT